MKETPTASDLLEWRKMCGADKKKFVNTNGKKYKELGLKDTIDTMPEAELFALIATDPMLIKRPLLIGENFVLFGFRKKEWEESEW